MESTVKRRKGSTKNNLNDTVKDTKRNSIEESTKENKRLQLVHDGNDVDSGEPKNVTEKSNQILKNSLSTQKCDETSKKNNCIEILSKCLTYSPDLSLTVRVEYDLVAFVLFIVAFVTRTYKLWIPNNVV